MDKSFWKGRSLMKSYSIITPTGYRPYQFELCSRYVQRQSIKPTQWIIVDDGEPEINVPGLPYVEYIRRPVTNEKSLHLQIKAGLECVETDYVVIMEDDDWYAWDYCEMMLKMLENVDLAGNAYAIYYHIPARKYYLAGKNCSNFCGLCQTVFKASLIPQILKLCTEPYLDIKIWRQTKCLKYQHKEPTSIYMSTKGLGSKRSLGMGQDPNWNKYTIDRDENYLKSMIGDDVLYYRKWMQ